MEHKNKLNSKHNNNKVLLEIAMEESINNECKKSKILSDHHIFIVGRGRKQIKGYLNLPQSDLIPDECIYVDPNAEVEPDIRQKIEDIDFNFDDKKSITIIFDFSTFYCTAMRNVPTIAYKMKGRSFNILVPLSKDEKDIPSDLKFALKAKIFDINLVEGQYPLFDFSKRFVKDFINDTHYIMIKV